MGDTFEVCGVRGRMVVGGGLATIDLSGEIDRAALLAVKREVLDRLIGIGPVNGFLVDFTQAVVRCSVADLGAAFDGEGPADQAAAPAAMVVSADQMNLFKSHVWDVAWRGVVRQAFICRVQASAWIRERAAVAAQVRLGLLPAQ